MSPDGLSSPDKTTNSTSPVRLQSEWLHSAAVRGRDYDEVRRQRQDVVRFSVGLEPELDAESFAHGEATPR
jgi:hypothetical protein